jgi:hypothetical protein
MAITRQKNLGIAFVIGLLLATAGTAHAQSADQSFKSIPQQVKTNAENKATARSNDVSNAAMTKLDSASNRAFRKFTGLFKRKDHPANPGPVPDSTGVHRIDSTGTPPRSGASYFSISNHKNLAS